MKSLAIMEQGLHVSIEGEVLKLEREGERLRDVRLGEIGEVLLFGSIHVTPAVVSALLRRGIEVVYLGERGRYRGRLVGRLSKNVHLRLAQYGRYEDAAFKLAMARSVVVGKIGNQRALLLRSQREQKREDLADAIGGMRRMMEQCATAASVDELRGMEGQASSLYFGVFGLCIRNERFSFTRRTRRPPRDPVNAMLSFGYTLLGAAIESALLRAGLDPMLGNLHTPDYGRPSLMLDLIEEFRTPLVDALVLRLVNRRQVGPEDFDCFDEDAEATWGEEDGELVAESKAESGVWLNHAGRRVFFRAWGQRLHETVFYASTSQVLSYEDIITRQVQQYARLVRGEETVYQPISPR